MHATHKGWRVDVKATKRKSDVYLYIFTSLHISIFAEVRSRQTNYGNHGAPDLDKPDGYHNEFYTRRTKSAGNFSRCVLRDEMDCVRVPVQQGFDAVIHEPVNAPSALGNGMKFNISLEGSTIQITR